MSAGLLIVGLVAVALLLAFAWRRKRATPAPRRNDLLYGYYGCYEDQVAEVKDHTNLHWENFWQGLDKAVEDIRTADKFTVLDAAPFIFRRVGPKQIVLEVDPQARLRALFDRLRDAGALHLVKMVVPVDEPNLPENRACGYLPDAVKAIRATAAEYPELSGVLLGVIYYSREPFCHSDLFDVVSYDDYDRGALMLMPDGDYERFRATLKPGQRTMLITGGSYGQSPQPFIDYAMRNQEVMAVVPFLWWYPEHGEDVKAIRDLAVKDVHIAAGKAVTGA